MSRIYLIIASLLVSCGDDPCVSQCELAAGSCDETPLDAFPNIENTRLQWSRKCPVQSQPFSAYIVEGACRDGKRVLYQGGGFTSETRYFDADGNFLGLSTTTDVRDEECNGKGYWPERVKCRDPKVTEVVCGDSLKVGDEL